jgi:ATP-dependent protease ClpP protease subunit
MYCAGRERYSSPQARFLIHGVSMGFQGSQIMEEPQLQEKLKGLQIDIENIAKVIAENTGKDQVEVTKAMLNRTTLNPEQAKEWGLVSSIKTELFPTGTQVISIADQANLVPNRPFQ